MFLAWLDGVFRHGSGQCEPWWRPCGVVGKPFEVLDGGDQQELIAGASEAPQSEPDHREDLLGLAKEPFDLLALGSGGPIDLGLHQSTGIITSLLVWIPQDPTRPAFGGATRFQRTVIAITLGGDVAVGVVGMKCSGGLQDLTARTDI